VEISPNIFLVGVNCEDLFHKMRYPESKSEIIPPVPINGPQVEVLIHIKHPHTRSVFMPNKYMNSPTSCEVGHRLFDESAWLPTAPRHAPIVDLIKEGASYYSSYYNCSAHKSTRDA
jgi:hypothetical protein